MDERQIELIKKALDLYKFVIDPHWSILSSPALCYRRDLMTNDISDWTPEMLYGKIREIEHALKFAEIEYKQKVGHLLIDYGQLQKELSNRNLMTEKHTRK